MTRAGHSMGRVALRFVRRIVRTERAGAIRALTLSVAVGLTEGLGVLLLVPLLGSVGLPVATGGVGRIAATVQSVLAAIHVPATLGFVLMLYVAVIALQALLTRTQFVASLDLEHRFVGDLRKQLYAALARAEWTFQRSLRPSDVMHVLLVELDRTGLATSQLLLMSSNVVLAVIYVGLATRVSMSMTLVVVAAGAVVLLSLWGRVSRSGSRGEAVSERSRQMTAELADHLGAMRLTKALNFEDRQIAAVSATASALSQAQHRAVRLHAGSRTTIEIGGVVALALLLYVGLNWVRLDTGGVILLLYLFTRLMPRLSALQQSAQHVAHYLPSFVAAESLITAAAAAREVVHAADGRTAPEGDVRFENVSFTHPGKVDPAVRDLSFAIPARGFVAIVGPSGAGKSTIADLLCGLIRPDTGRITVGGAPIDETTRSAWRQSVGYVDQEAFIFNSTIRSNLEWILPGATDAQMIDALTQASAQFVFEMPDGLATETGDRGSRLSGGERQRLALARALMRRPRLLVLDEPTSALDAVNEARVLDAIEQLSGRITIVLITHRLAAVRRAQTILVVEDGRLVEGGDWGTLRAQSAGRFKALWDAQDATVDSAAG